jgi:hypothetical protein
VKGARSQVCHVFGGYLEVTARLNPSHGLSAFADPELTAAVFSSQTFLFDRYHHICLSSTHPYTSPPSFIMTEYVKIEKIVPKFPPPAFGDIAKASNDVCLACLSGASE